MAKLTSFLAPLVTLVVLAAGCSSPSGESVEATATPAPTFLVVADNQVPAPTFTDTYHLLDRPEMTPRVPTAMEPLRLPVDSFFMQTQKGVGSGSLTSGNFLDTWNTTLPTGLDVFAGNATLWVEVTGTLAADPRTNIEPGCFWVLSVGVGPYETSTESHDLGCIKTGPEVPAGLYKLVFPFTVTDVAWSEGTLLRFEFHSQEPLARPSGAKAELLTGSVAYDSTVRVFGLELPLDAGRLLTTTS